MTELPKPFFVLAPMDDVTDTVFRRIVSDCAPADLYISEFVNVDGLQSPGRPRLLPKLNLQHDDGPVVLQLWGKTPEHYFAVARSVADGSMMAELTERFGSTGQRVNFAGIDINMGCPEKNVFNNGCCSALINNRTLAVEIIKAVQEGVSVSPTPLPVSVKTRLGVTTVDLTWHELLLHQKLAMLTVHGRTRKEMSKVPAHWDVIGEIVQLRDRIARETMIVGNGDVRDREHGLALASETGVDGIMIGRGIFNNPYAFAADPEEWLVKTKAEKLALYRLHVELFATTWKQDERKVVTLNKFCKVYISGFDGASELREKLMACRATDELLAILDQVLAEDAASTNERES